MAITHQLGGWLSREMPSTIALSIIIEFFKMSCSVGILRCHTSTMLNGEANAVGLGSRKTSKCVIHLR